MFMYRRYHNVFWILDYVRASSFKVRGSILEANHLPLDYRRWLLPDFVSVEKLNGMYSLTDSSCCQPHPPNTRWVSPAERRLAQVRMAEDAGEVDQYYSDATCVPDSKSRRGLSSFLDLFLRYENVQ